MNPQMNIKHRISLGLFFISKSSFQHYITAYAVEATTTIHKYPDGKIELSSIFVHLMCYGKVLRLLLLFNFCFICLFPEFQILPSVVPLLSPRLPH